MRSWSVSSRFTLSLLVFSLPLIAMIYYLYVAANEAILFSAKEVDGVVLMKELTSFQSSSAAAHFKSLAEDKDISAGTKEDLQKKWEGLLARVPSQNLNVEKLKQSFVNYLSSDLDEKKAGGRFLMFNQDLIAVRERIADNYNIVLDPDLDSFYAMDLLMNWLPKISEAYIQFGQFTGGADEVMYEFQKSRLLAAQTQFEDAVKRIIINLDKIKLADAEFYDPLEAYQNSYQSYQENIREQLREVYSLVINVDRTLTQKKATYEKLMNLSKANIELVQNIENNFESFLKVRMDHLVSARNTKLYMSIVAILVASLLSAYLGYSIHRTFRTFSGAVKTLKTDAQVALEIGQNLIQASGKVSQASSTQAAAIEETSASLEELSSMVAINAQNSLKARDLANEAKAHSAQGSQEMQALMTSMNEIAQSSKKIEEIMQIIDDIAFQTNLLALNASVEAARAGEHGKGFAVVADAVRALAQKSADSAKEIGVLITESMQKIDFGKNSADRSSVAMQSIMSSIENVNVLNSEIANASQEQTAGIQQISQAVSELEKATLENTGVAHQSSDYSNRSLHQAEELMEIVSVLEAELLGASRVTKHSTIQ